MPITLLRHAQSRSNARQFETEKDVDNPDLTERGRQQARQLEGHYDLVILSPLDRTVQTLTDSQITADALVIADEFKELGTVRGDDLAARLQRAAQMLVQFQQQYPEILVVSHQGFIDALLQYLGISYPRLPNASSVTIELE